MGIYKIGHFFRDVINSPNRETYDGFYDTINTKDMLESESPNLLIKLLGKKGVLGKMVESKTNGVCKFEIDIKLLVEIKYYDG